MASIISAGQFNPAALQASGLYIQVVNPPSYVRGVPTDVVGFAGTASWGPVNIPVHLGNGQDGVRNFGPVNAASVTDVHDLPTDITLAFLQASSAASLEAWCVRVTDGTDTAAAATITGVATAASETATLGGTITPGDTLELTATSASITGSPVGVTYTTLAGDTLGTAAIALAALVNAQPAYIAENIYAAVAGDVITLYAPTAITVTWSKTIGGGSPTETITLATGAASTTGAAVKTLYTGSGGNSATSALVMTLTAGVQTNTFNVSLVPPFGGNSELFIGLPGGNGFWAALKSALNSGISSARGPSNIANIPGPVNRSVGAPTLGTYSFIGGTDGRSGVTTATLLGSATATPATGFYALGNLTPAVGIAWITGLTDPAAIPDLVASGQSYAWSEFWSFPADITTSAATADVATYGASDPSLNYCKDWIYFFDVNNNITRLVPPTAVIAGMWATYAPQNSPDNKPVNGVIGTERNNPITGNTPYSISEIGQLQAAGITIITNPINAGTMWGTWGGRSTSQDPATQPSEYWRMTMYLARSFATFGGKYVGQLQSQSAQDPLRTQLKLGLNQFLSSLGNQIDNFKVLCELTTVPNASPGFGYNTPVSIAEHFLYAMCLVGYLSSVWFFILSLQGGTTVAVQISLAGGQPQAQAA